MNGVVAPALKGEVEAGRVVLGVIGLGYVGLPVAVTFADAGFQVVGVDINADRVLNINAGQCPIEGSEPGLAQLLERVVVSGQFRATTAYDDLASAQVVLVNVETPVNAEHRPNYDALGSACRDLGRVLRRGALVIVESTIAPGTMDNLVTPWLEESSGWKIGEGLLLGHCPERVMPGKLLSNLRMMPRVCGGATPEATEIMIALYRRIVDAALDPANCLTAELVKTAENAYRDVNIAFANEVALICEAVGGDIWKVRELVNRSPGRAMLLPGAGVGGHCIPKDPWLLAAAGDDAAPIRLISAARAVNDAMPLHVGLLVREALVERGRSLLGSRICVLGYAYLDNSDDTRNSPSEVLVDWLRESGAAVVVHDPFVHSYDGAIEMMIREADAVVVMVAHQVYRDLTVEQLSEWLARVSVVVDGRNVWGDKLAHLEQRGTPTVRVIGRAPRRK